MSDESNVVGIHGWEAPRSHGEAVASIVEKLEDALARARAGEIIGLGLALVIDDGTPMYSTAGSYRYSAGAVNVVYAMEAAIRRLARGIDRDVDRGFGDD